jgi:hypothetical protein
MRRIYSCEGENKECIYDSVGPYFGKHALGRFGGKWNCNMEIEVRLCESEVETTGPLLSSATCFGISVAV